MKQHTKNGLTINSQQETWMDTKHTPRSGFRIEIQALRLSAYNFLFKLTNEKIYQVLKSKLDILEQLTIRYGINKRMEEERIRRAKLKGATISIGMTIPQIMNIIGEPVEIIHKQSLKGKDSQLWLYPMHNDRNLELSFLDYRLFKIE